MQSLDDDMEDLFRRAGEDYLLKTDGSNWQKVQQALNPNDGDTPAIKKHDYRFFWLLLLLPFAFICGRYTGTDSSADSIPAAENTSAGPTANEAEKYSKNKPRLGAGVEDKKSAVRQHDYLPNNAAGYPGSSKPSPKSTTWKEQRIDVRDKTGNYLDNEKPRKKESKFAAVVPSRATAENDIIQPQSPTGLIKNAQSTYDVDTNESEAVDATITETAAIAKDPLVPQVVADELSSKIAQAKKKDETKKGLYYAFVVAPDISTVRFKQIQKLGYSAGILVGYKTGKRIRLETGQMWSNKN